MFHPSSNTARTHTPTSISTLQSLVNFCSRDFLFHKEFDDSTLAKRHIVVGHFVRSDTSHVMQAIDVTRHSRITQQLVPSTTALSFVCCSQFACKKKSCSWLSVRPSYVWSLGGLVSFEHQGQASVFKGSCNERWFQVLTCTCLVSLFCTCYGQKPSTLPTQVELPMQKSDDGVIQKTVCTAHHLKIRALMYDSIRPY